ncbi:Histone deacetylase [Melia azedarach]|uniref:Histone deacetylase n=1 Tax=Melia azedarach TaxID=155640 RepID=A0ACC1XNX4_MELAZ|nr:Histone deacetylase [Melia azedarach]
MDSTAATSWRSDFSKVNVWYATYGSNMWQKRFFCYIRVGQEEAMQKECPGSKDKTLVENLPPQTWGRGGAAFLNPESSNQDQAHLLVCKIMY